MRISVILSTYNAPRLLELVLHGYGRQDHSDFELVIADDGSTEETAQLIERLGRQLKLSTRHVWHEDSGFRKCTILNKAIEACDADYLVFSDGDCIPRRDFLSVHAERCEPGYFVSGGYFKLSREISEAITTEDVTQGRATDVGFLRGRGLRWSPKNIRLSAGPRLAPVLDSLTSTRPTWNGHNASGWREDILRANGFDERMKYGGEDRELGERLINSGIRARQIRHRAICVHLWHERGYVRSEEIEANREIRRVTARDSTTTTPYGIVKQSPAVEP